VNGFLTVDVGLVLEMAAEGVADGFEDEAGDGDGEEENDEADAGGERVPSSSSRRSQRLPKRRASEAAKPAHPQ